MSTVQASVTTTASTWAPVVIGTASSATNIEQPHADPAPIPVFHYFAAPPAVRPTPTIRPRRVPSSSSRRRHPSRRSRQHYQHLLRHHLSDRRQVTQSCPSLSMLTSEGTRWTENASPPCGGDVSIISDVDEFAAVSKEDIQGWSCSVHTTYPTYPTDWQRTRSPPTPRRCLRAAPIRRDGGPRLVVRRTCSSPGRAHRHRPRRLVLGARHRDSAAAGGHSHGRPQQWRRRSGSGSPLPGELVSFTDHPGQNTGVAGTCGAGLVRERRCEVRWSSPIPTRTAPGTDTINAATTVGSTTEHATASMTSTPVSTLTVDAGPEASGAVGANLPLNGSSTGSTSTTWSLPPVRRARSPTRRR